MSLPPANPGLLEQVIPIVRRAADLVMEVYASDFVVHGKQDNTPVTEADRRAEAFILPALESLLPGVPVVAEEAVADGLIPQSGDRFWLLDPLDGTKEFIERNGEFTINAALIEHGYPVLGVVMAPALNWLFAGVPGHGAFIETAEGRRRLACRATPQAGLTVVTSRSHGDGEALRTFLQGRKVAGVKCVGSSLKLCLVAAGEADVYPRLGRTMEWDIAAGHAVLQAAGGRIVDMAGQALAYDKPGFYNPHFVAWGLSA